uniref:Uncharacterized protein n=1 Tax=Angomonas deanei TaxID=59799 RepID=C6K3K9_9TRYP|nr:conserved hypothetical protein [Angomonas deanei]
MSIFGADVAVYSGREKRFATPTRRRSPFCAADEELSALTSHCAAREHDFVGRPSNSTPVRLSSVSHPTISSSGKSRENTSPVSMRVPATRAAVSPRRRRCTGAGLNDVDGACASPRIHLAIPASARRLRREQSQLCERSCSWMVQDSASDLPSAKASLNTFEVRSVSGPPAITPSLSITPTDTCEDSTSSKYPFLRLVSEPIAVDGSIAASTAAMSPHADARPPSSPSFSFFTTAGERRATRFHAAFDSARESHDGPSMVSPRSFAFRSLHSPSNNDTAATASLSDSHVGAEGKIFSPLRFDARVAYAWPPPNAASMLQQRSSTDCVAADAEEGRPVVGTAQQVAQQQRLLHACVVAMSREKAELEKEVRRLRQRRVTSLLLRLLHLLVRLPCRILSQCFRVLMSSRKKLLA